jgi:dienelactone hydrolase
MGYFSIVIWLGKWIINWVKRFVTPSDKAWAGATKALVILGVLYILSTVLFNLLPYFSKEKLMGFSVSYLWIAGMAVGTYFLVHIAKRMPNGFRFAALLLLLYPFFMMGGIWGSTGSAIFVGTVALSTLFIFGSIPALFEDGFKVGGRKKAMLFFMLGLFGAGTVINTMWADTSPVNLAIKGYQLADNTLDLSNPGVPGDMAVQFLTYGSGTDKHRPEYGADVTLKTTSTDGSKLVKWTGILGWARSSFWGFDATEFPRNGRVWMPADDTGEGPYPLVLIVHGNHGMEDFSDPGYEYLGRLMASKGYIFVSVDENFLNSSMADRINPFGRGLSPENDARGWMLLEHLKVWREWSKQENHPMFAKVDMDNIALMGHSRGGEAVGVAASFNKLSAYPDDALLTFDYGFNIKGVIAIAPVDGKYKPRNQGTPLVDVNYFSIHGSGDGDVDSFRGLAQYNRDTFTGNQFNFKSTLYVEGANHGQFNTGWGRNDFGKDGWQLDTDHLIDGEDQRQIGKVFFGAFLDATLKGKTDYIPLFSDPSLGTKWLPNFFSLTNYADSNMQYIAQYEEDIDATTATMAGVRIGGKGLSKWREEWVAMKEPTKPYDSHVAVIGWDDRIQKEGAHYGFNLDGGHLVTVDSVFAFSVAEGGESSLPRAFKGDKDPKELKADSGANKNLDWTIVLYDANGEEAKLILSSIEVLYPQLKARTRRANFLYDKPSSEQVMRRYAFPMAGFLSVNPKLDVTKLTGVGFLFDKSKRGVIRLDDVGFTKGY